MDEVRACAHVVSSLAREAITRVRVGGCVVDALGLLCGAGYYE